MSAVRLAKQHMAAAMDGQLDRMKQLPDRLAGPVDLASREKMIMTLQAGEKLMSLTDVSEMLGIPVHTLYRWRYKGDGPVGYRVGRHVRCQLPGV